MNGKYHSAMTNMTIDPQEVEASYFIQSTCGSFSDRLSGRLSAS